jgi:cation:H+ antiporter
VVGRSIELVVSLAVLMAAGDQFVIGAVRLASALRVRPIVVGAVVGGLGSSLPELTVSGLASVRGDTQLAVGNLIGSNIANIALGIGIAALIAPVRVDSRTVRREAPISFAAVVLLALVALSGLSRLEGSVLLVVLAAALVALLANARAGSRRDELGVEVVEFFEPAGHSSSIELVRALAGVGFMLAASEVMIRAASSLAGQIGVSPGFIGLTVVALGTSAPQLAIAIQAARRGDHDLVIGNVLGSNIFIALGGGSLVGFLHHGPAPDSAPLPVWMMAGIALASWGFMARGSVVTRWEGGILILAYVATVVLAPH